MSAPVDQIFTEEVEKIVAPGSNLSLDTLILIIHAERLAHLRDQTNKELKELSERQSKVRGLHDALRSVNQATNTKGEFDLKDKPEMHEIFKKAKEHGLDINLDKKKYSKDERDRLLENIRMTIEDLNVQNDMQLQTVQRLTNERYESYQMARSILKPLHDDKLNKARQMAGR